jgi:SAM-dependent methyltransferase
VFKAADDHLILAPSDTYSEVTKFVDETFHADGRDETVSPPLLSAALRHRMLRAFLSPAAGDRVLDLGCGNGRFAVWNLDSGAHLVGVDTAAFFAAETRASVDLIVGDLRRLPFEDGSLTHAYAIDVFEHFSLEGLQAVLDEVSRVLVPGGRLFVYTHLTQRSRLAPLLAALERTALMLERWSLTNLTLDKLRKTDHLNPLGDRAHLDQVAATSRFRVTRFHGYTPVMTRLIESIAVPFAANVMARRAAKRASSTATTADASARRSARVEAKRRIAQRGTAFRVLEGLTSVMMFVDVTLLGRLRTGPFFALLTKDEARG